MHLRLIKKKIATLNDIAVDAWRRACAQNELTWRCVANLRPWLQYRKLRKPLAPAQQRLLSELVKDGIVMTSVGELLENGSLFAELEASVRRWEELLSQEIESARQMNGLRRRTKNYFLPLLGQRPTLDFNDVFVRFAVQQAVLGIANSYFGMLTRFRYCNIWHNFPTASPPQESQLWHRDPEDRAVLKLFLYLTDVDQDAGPLFYAPGTHLYGDVRATAPFNMYREGPCYVRRSTDDQMSTLVPQSKWVTAIGRKGTIVFADTRGYHKGGYVRRGERILYMCTFTSHAAVFPDVFQRAGQWPAFDDTAVAFALGHAGARLGSLTRSTA